jgi:hypothetical protein
MLPIPLPTSSVNLAALFIALKGAAILELRFLTVRPENIPFVLLWLSIFSEFFIELICTELGCPDTFIGLWGFMDKNEVAYGDYELVVQLVFNGLLLSSCWILLGNERLKNPHNNYYCCDSYREGCLRRA